MMEEYMYVCTGPCVQTEEWVRTWYSIRTYYTPGPVLDPKDIRELISSGELRNKKITKEHVC